jgi:hypothetical protein
MKSCFCCTKSSKQKETTEEIGPVNVQEKEQENELKRVLNESEREEHKSQQEKNQLKENCKNLSELINKTLRKIYPQNDCFQLDIQQTNRECRLDFIVLKGGVSKIII